MKSISFVKESLRIVHLCLISSQFTVRCKYKRVSNTIYMRYFSIRISNYDLKLNKKQNNTGRQTSVGVQ